jgi:outer membrane scaffolding protein for murein synthesis (MipA/OmpV family)
MKKVIIIAITSGLMAFTASAQEVKNNNGFTAGIATGYKWNQFNAGGQKARSGLYAIDATLAYDAQGGAVDGIHLESKFGFAKNLKSNKSMSINDIKLGAGYNFKVNDSFQITPLAGLLFENQKYKNLYSSKMRLAFVGMELNTKLADNHNIKLRGEYYLPHKVKFDSANGRGKGYEMSAAYIYNLDKNVDLSLSASFRKLNSRSKVSLKSTKIKTTSLMAGVGYRF